MKHFISTLALLTAFLLLDYSCRKKEETPVETPAPVTPDPYTYNPDLQSSKDISFAMLALTDVDMLCSSLAEGALYPDFYGPLNSSSGSAIVTRDTVSKLIIISYNNVLCKDGKVRDGTLVIDHKPFVATLRYSNAGFAATVILVNYTVDGWKIELFDATKPARIANTLSSSGFDPSATSLSWQFKGKFKLSNAAKTKDIVWDGDLNKVLANTDDPTVYHPDKQGPVNWKLAKMDYSGSVSGGISGSSFTYVTDATTPPRRDFNCVVTPAISANAELHPFTAGAALFKISTYHPRSINYGPVSACDVSGTISFKDETHTVDFE